MVQTGHCRESAVAGFGGAGRHDALMLLKETSDQVLRREVPLRSGKRTPTEHLLTRTHGAGA